MGVCSKCGFKAKDEEKFCKVCGTKLVKEEKAENNISTLTNKDEVIIANTPTDLDEDLTAAYVGENYEKIKKGGFSVWVILFGAFYFVYRKLWIAALIFIGCNFAIGLLFGNSSGIPVLIFEIYLASIFNKKYIAHVKEKVTQIKNENKDKSYSEIKEICKKRGGTSWVGLIIIVIFYLIFIGLVVFLFSNYSTIDDNSSYHEELSNEVMRFDLYE